MRKSRKQAAAETAGLDLGQLFTGALDNVSAHREQINALDGRNGNHGDNMVHNLQVITQAVQSQAGRPPAEQLQHAANELQTAGRGSTGQGYARGLGQAAQQLQGKASLNQNDLGTLLQSVMGQVPVQPAQPKPSAPQTAAGGELGALLGMLGGASPQTPAAPTPAGGDPLSALLSAALGGEAPAAPQPTSAGAGELGALLGMLGGQAPSAPQPAAGGDLLTALMGMAAGPSAPTPNASAGSGSGLDLGDLLTAGMAFMQAKQQGADTGQAALQAVMSALAGGQVNPLQAGSPQTAAGGLLAQGLLQAALGRK
ncbi:MAG: DAK2 domain-containing protein [Anaerolineales bacterium]|nr:DAK2 domain-containing protein [Anaerolineales bacterium]